MRRLPTILVLSFVLCLPSIGFGASVGDVNGDGSINQVDIFYFINFLFSNGAPPIGSADVNGDGSVNPADIFYLINYLFAGGPPPVCAVVTVTNPPVSTGAIGTAFSQTFAQSGGNGGLSWSINSGSLPAGLTLHPTTGILDGTPAQPGSFPITVKVVDADGCIGIGPSYDLSIACQTITITNPATATGTVGAAFSQTFTQSGAIGGATFSTTSTLPSGLTLGANGTLSGTPAQAGTFPIAVRATDGNGCSGLGPVYSLTIGCQTITVTNPAVSSGVANAAFSQTFTAANTVGTTTFTLASGPLPAGLTLAANGTLSGAPTQIGTFPITVTATDANGCSATGPTYNLTISCQTVSVTNPAFTTGTVSSAFSQTFTANNAVGATTFTTNSTLPAGLTLAANGTLSGTPSQTGTFPIVVKATDANGCFGSGATYNLVIGCQAITVTNPSVNSGTIATPFSQSFTQSGVVGGATFTTVSTLPGGLTLAADGTLSGTPGQLGSFPIVVTVSDGNGCTGNGSTYTLVIACQTITVTNPGINTGTVGVAFTQTFTESGAIGGATFSTISALPNGLTLASNGTLSGTPAQSGTFPIAVKATDANGCSGTGTNYNLTIACGTITVTNPAIASGTAGTAFSQSFTQSGGFGATSFSTASTPPAGLTLAPNGTLSGTPTQTGTFPIVVTATDSAGCSGSGATYNLAIGCQTITVNNPATTTGTANAAFSQTFTASNSIGATAFTTASTLPAGLILATSGTLSGTPTQTGTFPITVTATDANGCNATGLTYNLTINCQTIAVSNPATTTGTISTVFSQNFTANNAIGATIFTTASTPPPGLTLATSGTLTGTPTQTGTFPIVVKATDANGCFGTGATYTLVIGCQTITVTNPTNASGTVSTPFSEQFTQSGAVGGATFTTASSLPAGLSLSTSGLLSGTPLQNGAFGIVVTVTDANGCSGSGTTYNLSVACQLIAVGNPVTTSAPAGTALNINFTQSGAVGGATFTTASILPAGLTLATNGTLSGTPSGGAGSFPIAVTVTDGNGCTGTNPPYTLTITCPTITVTNPSTATGTVGVAFSQNFSQSGGNGAITFTTASALPTGLTLATNGTLSGTPSQSGSFSIVVTATDANGCTGNGSAYNLNIACPTITVNNPGVTTGTVDAAFSQNFTQTGAFGTPTFTTASPLPAGLTLASNGILSGTPTVKGTFPIVVTVTDSAGCTANGASYNLVINCQTINVTNPVTNTGTVDAAFSQQFNQSGAHGTATFTTPDALPAGLTLSASGLLSGSPSVKGTFPIIISVTDSNGCTGTGATYTLTISCQTITVINPVTTTGTVNSPFSQQFTQSGAHGTATFTTASTLPTGFSLDPSTGILSGTTMQHTTFPIVVTVTDSNSCTGTSAIYNLTINCQGITVTNPANTAATINVPFSEQFLQAGGIGGGNFSTISALPTGLSLSTAGLLSGTPTQLGTFNIIVGFTDGNGCTGSGPTYALVVACNAITVTKPGIDTGTAGVAFSQQFLQSGGNGTITWSKSGSLPTGINLDSASGVLSGTTNLTGTFPITVTATDQNGCSGTGATYNLTINCQSISITNPAQTTVPAGQAINATFTASGILGTPTWSETGALPSGISLSTAGVLSGTSTQSGSYPLTIKVTDTNGCFATSSYTLDVTCPTITPARTGGGAFPLGTIGTAYNGQSFTATGGTGPYSFGVSSGTFPPGLSLATNGTISGTPTATGTFIFGVTATDATTCTGTASFSIAIKPAANGDSYSNLVNNTEAVVTGGTTVSPTTPFVALTGTIIANDLPSGGVALTAGTFSSANGTNNVIIAADGTFKYTPPVTANALSSDTFTYTITSNTGGTGTPTSANGTVTLNFTGRVWYVKNNGGGTNGQSQSPFLTLAQAQTGSTANDIVFVYNGDGTTLGQNAGITLKTGQQLIGEGVELVVNGNTLVVNGSKPLIGNTTGPAVTLANGNTLKGFTATTTVGATLAGISGNALTTGPTIDTVNVGPTTGSGLNITASGTVTTSLTNLAISGAATTALNATTFGTLSINANVSVAGVSALTLSTGAVNGTFTSVSSTGGTNGVSLTGITGNFGTLGGTLTGATGATFSVTNGTFSSTWQGSITQANNAALLSITGHSTGTITFNTGTLSSTNGTGLQFSGATGTYNFNGPTTLNGGTAGIGIAALSNGTFSFGTGVLIGSTASPAGTAFTVNGSNPSVTYSGNITQTTANDMVNITNQASGTITFQTGTLNSTAGNGVVLSNADGTVNFNGTATLNGAVGIDVIKGTGGTISFGANTSITTATAPFVLDGSGANAPAVNGNITYSGTINSSATGTLLNINTLSGTLLFNGSTLSGSSAATAGIVATIANLTGTLTTNHLSLTSNVNNFAGTLVNITGTNTGGSIIFNNLTLSATGTNHTGQGLVDSGTNGTVTVTGTGGASSINTGGPSVSLNTQSVGTSTIGTLTCTAAGSAPCVSLTGAAGSLTISGGSLTGAGASAFLVSGGTVSVTDAGTITQATPAQPALTISNGHNSGTLTFSGAITASNGTGLAFDNADGTYNISNSGTALSGGAHVDILNGSSGTFSFASGMTITNPGVTAFNVNNSNPNATYSGSITTNASRPVAIDRAVLGACGMITFQTGNITANSGSNGILVNNCNAGTITFTNPAISLTTTTNTGVTMTNNSGTLLVDFSPSAGNGLDVVTTTGKAFTATGAGKLKVTGSGNTLATNTAGTGNSVLEVDGVTIDTGGLNFVSLDGNGNNAVTKGVYIHNAGSGGLTVAGTGSAGTGGTIQNYTQKGIHIDTANNISLTNMNISGNGTANLDTSAICGDIKNGTNTNCAAGVDLQTVTTASMTGVHVSNGVQAGVNGRNVTGLTLTNVEVNNFGNETNECGIQISNLFGTLTWSGLNIHDNASRQVNIQNSTTPAINLTINNSTFANTAWPGSATSAQGILFSGSSSANMTISVQNSTIARNFGPAIQSDSSTGATLNTTFNGGSLIDNGQHFVIASTGSGNMTYALTNVTTAWVDGTAVTGHSQVTPISIFNAGSGTFIGSIISNIFGLAGTANSSACNGGCNAMVINNSASTGSEQSTITGNTIQRSGGGGISVLSGGGGGTSTMRVKIENNTLNKPDGNGTGLPIAVTNTTVAGDATSTCANILNNSINNTGGAGTWNIANAIRLRNPIATAGPFTLPGYLGAATDYTAIVNYLNGRNTITGGSSSVQNVGSFSNTPGGADCY